MTKTEQVEVIRRKIKFEKEMLDYHIKRKEVADKEFKDCSFEEIRGKQIKVDLSHTAIINQYMDLCGVLATAYELKLISKDENNKLRKQVFDEVFN